MDNASKALIMAGAVLIAVLIVSLSVLLYRSTQPMVEMTDKQLTARQRETFNNRFTKYDGDNRTGSDVISLLNAVDSYNKSAESADFGTISKSGVTETKNVDPVKRYNISFSYGGSGIVNGVKVDLSS